jgi:hypothetical protein
MLMMIKLKNLEFEPVHPKNVLLASVVHGISCLFSPELALEISKFQNSENEMHQSSPTDEG